MGFKDFKYLPKRIDSDKVLCYKEFNFSENPKYDGYQRDLASLVFKFFDKQSASLLDKSANGSGFKNISNEKLAEELHKPIIRKIKSTFIFRIQYLRC